MSLSSSLGSRRALAGHNTSPLDPKQGAGGKLSFTLGAGNLAVTSYVRKYGGQAMDDPELGRHFAAYKASGQFEMTEGELTAYLAAAARNIPNAKFDEMMAEMSS